MKKKMLILTDGKAGHENQSKAFARMLGYEAEVFEIHFRSKFAKALSYFADFLSLKIAKFFDRELPRGDFACVVGAGSGTFYAVKVIAKILAIPSVAILYPRGYQIREFSCVFAPAFDRPKRAKNVIVLPANLVANDAAFYDEGVRTFREKYSPARENAVAVIIGGPNAFSTMTADWMKKQLDEIFAKTPDTEHWVTTSRRTPKDVEEVVDAYAWDYKLIYSREKFNPIPAFVKRAKKLFVTAESTGMLSEACSCGAAEVFAMDNLNAGDHKFRRFVDALRAGGYCDGSRKIDLSREMERAAKIIEGRVHE